MLPHPSHWTSLGDPGADGMDGDPGQKGKQHVHQNPSDKTINSVNDYIFPREPDGLLSPR